MNGGKPGPNESSNPNASVRSLAVKRDRSVDLLRGLAVFTMICANSAGYLLAEPHPFWLRCYGSFAAPFFLTLSGLMTGAGVMQKKVPLGPFFQRAAIVLALAAFMDTAVWNIWPFMTFDVLYVIGFSLPAAAFFRSLSSPWVRWGLTLAIFGLAPWMQAHFGYTDRPTEIKFPWVLETPAEHPTSVLQHLFVDGWFPIFPWMGFAFLGANLWEARLAYGQLRPTQKMACAFLALGLLTTGFWSMSSVSLMTREGYSELFYPPSLGYVLAAVGIMLLAFVLLEATSELAVWRPFELLGKSALAIYVLHYALLQYFLSAWFKNLAIIPFFLLYLLFAALMIVVASGLDRWKQRHSLKNPILRIVLGG